MVDPTQIFSIAKTFGEPFDVDLLVYDWTKISPQPTNPADGGMNIQIPVQWYVTYPEVFAEFLLHELCHYFFSTSGKTDLTHLKYDPMWNGRWNQLTNQAYYLFLLQQFIPTITPPAPITPTVLITRNASDSKQTLGTLRTSDGKFGCNSLELVWLNNKVNISYIPKGTYTCKWTFMLSELRYRYQIMNVPGRTGIFIHAGNYYFNSKGCIILGSLPQDINKDGELDLINSNVILDSFEKMMNKKDFTLIIQ
jgi:hypothetical protein